MTKHTVLREGTDRHDPCGEREAFEAMMRSQTFDSLKRLSDGSYESYEARVGWLAWNVRASHGQAPANPATVPAGWLPVHSNGRGFYGGPLKTEDEAKRYISQVERSNDSVTLIARPFAWVAATSTPSVQTEAQRLAAALDLYATGDEHQRDIEDAATELRRLHAQPAPATQQAGGRVYAFRRKGLADFCTCDEARYEELSNKPHLFETRIFYTAPQPSPHPTQVWPIAPDVAVDLERSDWTPEEALRWYAAGKHYDTVPNGDGSSSARILDNGAVASNALKSMSREYAEHKGDVALQPSPAAHKAAPAWEHHARKLTQWLHCMSHNDSYFGEPVGLVKQVTGELNRLIGEAPAAQETLPQGNQ